MKKQRIGAIASAGLLAATTLITVLTAAQPAHADTAICEKYGATTIQSGRYIVQNNNWGDDTTQCINVTGTGFSVTTASHNRPTNGAPGSYPSVYFGCHYGNCSAGSGLPLRADSSAFTGISTSVAMTYPGAGVWDAAYDIWFDPTARTTGQNTGAEIMVWLNHTGAIQPVGSQVGTVNLNGASWNVWFGNIGWNVISYVRTAATGSMNFGVDTFYADAVSRGYAQRSWYLTSIQAGFEPWVGQTGLAVTAFSVTTGGGGGGDVTPPSTPGGLTASGTTASSTNLSWGAASDATGVTGYDVFRAAGASGGSFTQVGTTAGTSFTASGLSASSTYRFYVRARDAAGNVSGNSNTVSVTTLSGGGGSGGCSATIVLNAWTDGYTGTVTVTNTGGGTISAWAVVFTLPPGHQLTNSWSAAVTVSGQTVTARNLAFNGTIAPGGSIQFGFQATKPANTTATPTLTCTAS